MINEYNLLFRKMGKVAGTRNGDEKPFAEYYTHRPAKARDPVKCNVCKTTISRQNMFYRHLQSLHTAIYKKCHKVTEATKEPTADAEELSTKNDGSFYMVTTKKFLYGKKLY